MATVLDISEKAGVWFEMDGGGRVQLRTMNAEAFKNIRRQTTKKRVDFRKVDGTPQRFEYEEVDDDKQTDLLWDYIIVAWEGLLDKAGNNIPCTPENKTLLMARSPYFMRFLTESLKTLTEDEQREAEASEKN